MLMTSLLVYTHKAELPDWLFSVLNDMDSGVARVAPVVHDSTDLVRQMGASAPDVLLCWAGQPDDAWFRLLLAAAVAVPSAVADLPALLKIARARFKHEQEWRQALNDATLLLGERKVVDRAKFILMQARQMSDDDAFRVLRTASMHSNQRLGLVGQHIIASARFAEGVNRAGQLRMLSQRLLTLYLFELAQPASRQGSARLDAALRIDTNLA